MVADVVDARRAEATADAGSRPSVPVDRSTDEGLDSRSVDKRAHQRARVERIANPNAAVGPCETLEKLYEDTHDRYLQPCADRKAIVRFNQPIDVTALLESGAKQKQLIHDLTDQLERRCQQGIELNNRQNHAAGKGLWSTPIGAG